MGANQSYETVKRLTEVADFDFREEEEEGGDGDNSWIKKSDKSWNFVETQSKELVIFPRKKQILLTS